MTSSECQKIEKELNSILRDLASQKIDDASCSVTSFPLPEKYETDFPPINKSPNKHDRKRNSCLSPQISNHLCNTTQEFQMAQTHRKSIERVDDFHGIQENDFHERRIRKRKDYMIKQKPRKLETNRNFPIKKQVIDKKQTDDKIAFDGLNPYSVNALGNKLDDKEIRVLTIEDLEVERDISTDPSKKLKNFQHAKKEKKKRPDHPKGMDDKKIQANIFLNALTEASKRGKTKKLIEEKEHCESQGTAHACENEIPLDYQYSTDICVSIDSSDQCRTVTSSEKKIVWNAHDNADTLTPLVTDAIKGEDERHMFKSGDEFINRCNKESCNCSENSLYCSLCDFHIDNQRELERHKKQITHEVRKKDCFRVRGLEALNPPSLSKLVAIEELLQKIYIAHVHGAEDGKQRREVVKELTDDLQSDIEKDCCTFHLFGSSVNGFDHKDSNVNIDLEVLQGISPSGMLLQTLETLKDRENKYGNIASDFSATFPSISFIDRRTQLLCEITLNNDASRKTSTILKQYAQFDDRVKKLGTIFRIWAKICGIDQQEFCSLPPHCFPLMAIHFLQQTDPPLLPVLHEMIGENDVLVCDMRTSWRSRNKQTLAELWVDLLKFYAISFQYKTHVISICQKEPLLCRDKKWTTRMMCIEDPYHTKRNIARTIANLHWFQYIVECIRSSYEYFCTYRLPEVDDLAEIGYCSNDEDESSQSFEENSIDSFLEDQDKELQIHSVVASIKAMDLGSRTVETFNKNENRAAYEQYKDTECVTINDTLMEKKHCTSEPKNQQTWENSSHTKESSVYKFERSYLINAKPPLLFCRQCQKANHVKKNCTIDDNLPELKKLPKMENDHRDMLTEVCEVVFSFCKPTAEIIQNNKFLLSDLQRYIQCVFKDAELELFGSSCNGFGFGDSDLDICLTFHNKSAEDVDHKYVIEQLTKELNKYKKLRNIIPIPTAKVPIIKCSFVGRKEGDISLYNTLGQHNTRLLSTYCEIDSRVQLLGYSLKFFAKKCDIGDASKGSLSSYAYILMAIFYLQQLEVPVIPVLQELYDHSEKMPERYVDTWNTWFFDDINHLPHVWRDYGKNKQCLGELWMGLLIFYTEKFKMADYVISIRQKAPLTRFEKLWNTRSIAIEDPFDHSHNLGAGVSRNMNKFILAAFRRGREHFGKIPPARRDLSNLLEYFFNSKILTGGEQPPNERGCRKCLKIGHKMKECPLRRENYKKRHNLQKRNNSNVYQQRGNFENRNNFADGNRVDRRSTYNARGTFRGRWDSHSRRAQRDDTRTVTNCNSNNQSS